MVARKTTGFNIPIPRFGKFIPKRISLDTLIERAAAKYNLTDSIAVFQVKKIASDGKPEEILQNIEELYKNHFDSLTTPAKIILASICAEQGEKKINWLKDKKIPNTERIKKVETLVNEAKQKEKEAAALYFLKPQKEFLDKYLNSAPEEIKKVEKEIDQHITAAISKKKSIDRLAEFVIESPENNMLDKFYEIYDKLQEYYWQTGKKQKCKQINTKKLVLLSRQVSLKENFKNYYYRRAKTLQRIAACTESRKQDIIEKCITYLEKRTHLKEFNHAAFVALGDLYVEKTNSGDSNALECLDRASRAYHTALKEENIKDTGLVLINSKIGNCHIGKLRLKSKHSIKERFLDYLQTLRHFAEADFILTKNNDEEELSKCRKKLGTTYFHLGKDLFKCKDEEFSKIAGLFEREDTLQSEDLELKQIMERFKDIPKDSSETVIKRVRSIMLPERYSIDQKEYLLIRVFSHARNNLRKTKTEGFYETLKTSEHIARSCIYLGRSLEKLGLPTNKYEEAKHILEDTIKKIDEKIQKKHASTRLINKLSKYHNYLAEAYFRLSQKGNVHHRIESKIKSIYNYFKTIGFKKEIKAQAHPACYSICATNYIDIAEIILEERVCEELPDICSKLGMKNAEKTNIAAECYTKAIEFLLHARNAGDYTAMCTAKIGQCHYELAKINFNSGKDSSEEIEKSLHEIEKAIKKDTELGNDKNPYLPPYWLKARLASFCHKNKINCTISPDSAWREFLDKSQRDYLKNITNCLVWRAKGRGEEQIKNIFKSPVNQSQSLKLEKAIIEEKNEFTKTGYAVEWMLENPEILILQSKGTKTINEKINESLKNLRLAHRIAQKQKGDIITDAYKHFHDQTIQLYKDAVAEMVKNSHAIKEVYNKGILHEKAKQEGFELDKEVIRFTLDDYYKFSDNAIDVLSLSFGKCSLPINTHAGQDEQGNEVFVTVGDKYEKKHLKAVLREIIKKCIWPMKEGFDFDPNLDNVMVYDDEEKIKVACGIDFEKLKIRKYIAGLCMLLFYDNPSLPKECSIYEEGCNFLTPSHKKEIIDQFIHEEENRGGILDRYKVHRDVAVYMPLRRLGLAANEKRKLNENRQLTETETRLLRTRQLEDIEWLKADVAYAIKTNEQNEIGKLYNTDAQYFTILNDIIKNMEITP